MFDVAIIGAGVSGCSVARYLNRYDLSSVVIEKESDVCCGTSKANSAIVHAGYDAKPGSMMARLNVEGSLMMEELSKELDFDYQRCGSIVVCTQSDDKERLQELYDRGLENGVEGLEILTRDKLRMMEPNISDDAECALWAPTGAIVCPFGLTIALAENAFDNGTEFRFGRTVKGIKKIDSGWEIDCGGEKIQARAVVNAAGVFADELHNMVSASKMTIKARRGDYYLLDKKNEGFVKHTIFQLPDELGKGVLVSPTVHGNTIIGPTAVDTDDKCSVSTTRSGFDIIDRKAGKCVKNIPFRDVITNFAGLRACESSGDFVIGEVSDAPMFFDCAGIASPGLSASPAIGRFLSDMIGDRLKLPKNDKYEPKRKGIIDTQRLSEEELNDLIKREPEYGRIICRCESITEGEIRDSIRRSLGATDLDGVKRRTRAGMGRCQSGFCSPRVMEILSEELSLSIDKITKNGGGSEIAPARIREDADR